MNKTRKGFLLATTILIIVTSALGILISFGIMGISKLFTEELTKETYLEDTTYTYYEEADGSYYFTYQDENGALQTVTAQDIKAVTTICKTLFIGLGVITLGMSIAKLAISIIVLNKTNKDVYSKGGTITLLVLSVLSGSLLEVIFLICVLNQKDAPKVTYESLGNMNNNQN